MSLDSDHICLDPRSRSGEASAVRYTLVTKHRAAHLARTPLSPLITSSTLAIGHDTILLEQGKPPAFLSSVFANYKYFWLKIVRQSHLALLCPSIRKLCMNPPLSVRRG